MTPPQRFGRYRIDARIGAGGMGTVWKAHDEKLGRTVALKVLAPETANDPELKARLVREARLAGALAHPSIVFVYEVVEVEGTLAVVMEHVEGEPLDRFAATDPPIAQRLAIVEALASALATAHEHGVVHRDVKPSNVIVPHTGPAAKLVDFGIAKALSPQATVVTRDALVLGTPRYMAPEQRFSTAIDARVDQFAWGVVAYELLAGVHPDEGMTDGRAVPLAWRCEEVGEERAAVIHRAMATDREARFASMRELLTAWQEASSESPPTRVIRAGAPPNKSNTTIFFVALVGSALLAGVVVLGLWLGRSEPGPIAVTPPSASAPEPASSSTASSSAAATPAMSIADAAASSTSPPKPRQPRIVFLASWFAKPDETRARIHRAMPALVACFAGKPLGPPGAHAGIHLLVLQDGTVTQSWVEESCYGAKCTGAKFWLPPGGKECTLKAFEPVKDVGPLAARHPTGVWVDIDVFP